MTRPTKLPTIPEAQVQATAIAMLRAWDCVVHRRNTGAMGGEYKGKRRFVRFSDPGASDVWAILPSGLHQELELKRQGERPSLDQVKWLMAHNGVGGSVAFWVDNLEFLERAYLHILTGYRIRYRDTTRWYRVKEGKSSVKVQGPSGDFWLEEA